MSQISRTPDLGMSLPKGGRLKSKRVQLHALLWLRGGQNGEIVTVVPQPDIESDGQGLYSQKAEAA